MEGGVIQQAQVGASQDPRESWVFMSACGPGSEKCEEEIVEFWNELNECVGSFDRNESVVMHNLGYKFQSGKWCNRGQLDSMECQEEMCAEQELVVGNSWSRKVMYINKRGGEWWMKGWQTGR